MDIHIPTETDIYNITYLIHKGWSYNKWSHVWSKEGCVRLPTWYEGQAIDRGREIDLTGFSTEDAVDYQDNLDATAAGMPLVPGPAECVDCVVENCDDRNATSTEGKPCLGRISK